MTYQYNRQHKELTPDTLLNSGLYMKINFDQARDLAGTIDENTRPIIGYEYLLLHTREKVMISRSDTQKPFGTVICKMWKESTFYHLKEK